VVKLVAQNGRYTIERWIKNGTQEGEKRKPPRIRRVDGRNLRMRDSRPVLLVEDDTIDAMTVQRAFRELNVSNTLRRAVNGEEALAFLSEPDSDSPCVILLDLNMPKMNGIEFLKAVKDDPEWRKIPIVVLTTSNEERDIVETFRLSVAGYIIKPVDYKKFVEAIRTIDLYWTISELPKERIDDRDAQWPVVSAGRGQSG
jgi:CheY-like chemotaxis protein